MKPVKENRGFKILFFIDTLKAGGKERQFVELLKQLSTLSHIKIELLMMRDDIHYREIHQLKLKIHNLNRKRKLDLFIFFRLFKIVKKIKPDIFHSWSTMTTLYGGLVVKLLKINHICGSVRGATNIKRFSKPWLVDKVGFWLSDNIVANSLAGLQSRNLTNNKKALVIPNGFDFSRIKYLQRSGTIREKFHIITDKIVGMVGSLDNRKDNEIFIKAAGMIIAERKDVTFLIVGEGVKYEYLNSLVDEKDRPYVNFTGRQEDIESIVNIFNIGVLTSKNELFREGISNSIMEYMALGKAVIATDSGGNSELVQPNSTGFLVKPKDLGELVEKINYLLDHPKIALDMGQAGKKRIEDKFGLEKMVSSYLNLYQSLLR